MISLFLLSLCLSVPAAEATPLRMDYTISDLGATYRYDFTLTLDNHDATWAPGQEWDWIIFGDNDSADTRNGFDTNGGGLGGDTWVTLSFAPPITNIFDSSGGHNGPSLAISTHGLLLPGWMPTAIGQSLVWAGTSTVFIPDGQLYWSSLFVGGARTVDFELAHGTLAAVPEPTTLSLLGLGLAGAAVRRFKKRR
jgi:hypothetical protein